jgi:recombination protein RecR
MTPVFEELQRILRKLPGLGYRSAERVALCLAVEKTELLPQLVDALRHAAERLRACEVCGNLCEDARCAVCLNPNRHREVLCVVERIPDLVAIDRSGAFAGVYHVLHGKLSPIHGVGPENLNFKSLEKRLEDGEIKEIILALSNDIEGEATCHFIQEEIIRDREIKVSRIGFGLPSGGGIVYADAVTLQSALEGRRDY